MTYYNPASKGLSMLNLWIATGMGFVKPQSRFRTSEYGTHFLLCFPFSNAFGKPGD